MAVLTQLLVKEQLEAAASLAQNKASPCILGGISKEIGQNIQVADSVRHNLIKTGKCINSLVCFLVFGLILFSYVSVI